jgi:hypothetical protein
MNKLLELGVDDAIKLQQPPGASGSVIVEVQLVKSRVSRLSMGWGGFVVRDG